MARVKRRKPAKAARRVRRCARRSMTIWGG